MSYDYYNNMTTTEKDKMVDGVNIPRRKNDHGGRSLRQTHSVSEDTPQTPKRPLDDNEDDMQDKEDDDFQPVQRRQVKKTRPGSSRNTSDETNRKLNMIANTTPNEESDHHATNLRPQQTHSQRPTMRKTHPGHNMTIFNSSTKNGGRMNDVREGETRYDRANEKNASSAEKSPKANGIKKGSTTANVTQHALNYAVTQQLPPFKIQCEPRVKEQAEGAHLIKSLFSFIQEEFKKLNKHYGRPMGFDTWYIDQQGSLVCYTKEMELFVYLWDITHYPAQLGNTKITPIIPVHLPPQHTLILKFVPKEITNEEIQEAIADICHSKYTIEEMKGSTTSRARHVRIDLSSKKELNQILQNGVFPMNGQLLEVAEFLAPPQILICARCNAPGHTKKECKEASDKCRRCGTDRTTGEHQHCDIKCHHCGGEHIATDYRCPKIAHFRRELIAELRRRPDLLPANVQLFIPVEFRRGGSNVIASTRANTKSLVRTSPRQISERNDNEWPLLKPTSIASQSLPTGCVGHQDMNEKLHALRADYEKMRHEFGQKEKELSAKQDKCRMKLSSIMNTVILQTHQQNECITKMYTMMNELIPVVSNSLKTIHTVIDKCLARTDDNESKSEFNTYRNAVDQHLTMLNDRNDMNIHHQQATANLAERMNDLLRQGIELLSSNEQ
jgi:hypothetical protein